MLQLALPLLDSGTGWLQLSFALCFSSYFPLSRFAVLWFALPAVGSALVLPAVGFAFLGSFYRFSRSSMFFSLSSYLCCFTSFLSPLSPWLWFRLCLSHHLLFGCGSVCVFLTTCSLAVVPSVLLFQSHFVVVYDCVARFWLPSNITAPHSPS